MHTDQPYDRLLLDEKRFHLTLRRLCHEILERADRSGELCIIGIQPRGSRLSDRLHAVLQAEAPDFTYDYGLLDITFYRDDFRMRDKPLQAHSTSIDFLTQDKHVILVDDVLYTGRTIQAALTAIQHFGRADKVELLTLIDRRFNRHLPISSDITGLRIDALDQSYVKVEWHDDGSEHRVCLFDGRKGVPTW